MLELWMNTCDHDSINHIESIIKLMFPTCEFTLMYHEVKQHQAQEYTRKGKSVNRYLKTDSKKIPETTQKFMNT